MSAPNSRASKLSDDDCAASARFADLLTFAEFFMILRLLS